MRRPSAARLGSTAALLAIALLLAACGSPESAGYPPIVIAADPAQASPLPDATGGEEYPALDLGALGANASSSEVPSAIPDGVEVGFTEEGYPYRGSPDAPVTVVEYSDYACPFCGRYTAQSVPALMERYALTGQVRFVFREFPLTGIHPTAPAGHAAALCSGEQGAELYWAVHDEIFVRQADWTGLPDPTDFFASVARGAGVELAAYEECLASGRQNEVIAAGIADAQALGFNGTPSFQLYADGVDGTFNIIGAQPLDVFVSYLDSLLDGRAPADPATEPGGQTAEPAGLPEWADVATGLRPDPDRPGVNLAGDQYKGNPDAALVVVEFSDFQCPFCRDHAIGVQPTIDERFVDTGDVLWVYKHLPLAIHPLAPTAGVAAECAGDQGRFWEMHELLFENLESWEQGDTDAVMAGLAGELGLDMAAFESCFDGRDALERVLSDQTDAQGIISSTPSFVFIAGNRGALMEGSLPLDQFIEMLEARLEQARQAAGG